MNTHNPSCGRLRRYTEPHVNSVLRLVGAWLFDTALNPRRSHTGGRAVALLALGKILVTPRRHGGRPRFQQGRTALPLSSASSSSSLSPSSPPPSCKVSPPHVARFMLALRLALTTASQQRAFASSTAKQKSRAGEGVYLCPATPDTVAAALRASAAVLGADLDPGARALLPELNSACSAVLAHHRGTVAGSIFDVFSGKDDGDGGDAAGVGGSSSRVATGAAAAAAASTGGSGGGDDSLAALLSGFSRPVWEENALVLATSVPPTSRSAVEAQRCAALFAEAYPLGGWLGARLSLHAARTDAAGQRSWCLQALGSQVGIPSALPPAVLLSQHFPEAVLLLGKSPSLSSSLSSSSQPPVSAHDGSFRGAAVELCGLRASQEQLLASALVACGGCGENDRSNFMAAVWLTVVGLHDAAASVAACWRAEATRKRGTGERDGEHGNEASAGAVALAMLGTSAPLVVALEELVARPFLVDRLWPYPSPGAMAYAGARGGGGARTLHTVSQGSRHHSAPRAGLVHAQSTSAGVYAGTGVAVGGGGGFDGFGGDGPPRVASEREGERPERLVQSLADLGLGPLKEGGGDERDGNASPGSGAVGVSSGGVSPGPEGIKAGEASSGEGLRSADAAEAEAEAAAFGRFALSTAISASEGGDEVKDTFEETFLEPPFAPLFILPASGHATGHCEFDFLLCGARPLTQVNELDVDVPTCVLEAIASLRLHAPLLGSTCRPTMRRILGCAATFLSRLACWHELPSFGTGPSLAAKGLPLSSSLPSISSPPFSSSSSSSSAVSSLDVPVTGGGAAGGPGSPGSGSVGGSGNIGSHSGGTAASSSSSGGSSSSSRSASSNSSDGGQPSYLKDLSAYTAARLRGIELGVGYDPAAGRLMLGCLSTAAAEALASGLECLHGWCLEAPWLVLPEHPANSPLMAAAGAGSSSSSSDGGGSGGSADRALRGEAAAAAALRDQVTLVALLCGAFVAQAPDTAASPFARAAFADAAAKADAKAGSAGKASSSSGASAHKPPASRHGEGGAAHLWSHVAGLTPPAARVGCLATQLLEALSRLVGSYPLGGNNLGDRVSDGVGGDVGGVAGVPGLSGSAEVLGGVAMSSVVTERLAMRAFATSVDAATGAPLAINGVVVGAAGHQRGASGGHNCGHPRGALLDALERDAGMARARAAFCRCAPRRFPRTSLSLTIAQRLQHFLTPLSLDSGSS